MPGVQSVSNHIVDRTVYEQRVRMETTNLAAQVGRT